MEAWADTGLERRGGLDFFSVMAGFELGLREGPGESGGHFRKEDEQCHVRKMGCVCRVGGSKSAHIAAISHNVTIQ